jgi:hypothetical protein
MVNVLIMLRLCMLATHWNWCSLAVDVDLFASECSRLGGCCEILSPSQYLIIYTFYGAEMSGWTQGACENSHNLTLRLRSSLMVLLAANKGFCGHHGLTLLRVPE